MGKLQVDQGSPSLLRRSTGFRVFPNPVDALVPAEQLGYREISDSLRVFSTAWEPDLLL